MKKRYLIVNGEDANPIPDKKKAKATHHIELSDAKYKSYSNSDYFVVVNGEPRVKTTAEFNADKAAKTKADALEVLIKKRDEKFYSMSVTTASGQKVWTNPMNELNFRGRLNDMLENNLPTCNWSQNKSTEFFDLSIDDMKFIIKKATRQGNVIWDKFNEAAAKL